MGNRLIFKARLINLIKGINGQFIPPIVLIILNRSKTSRRQLSITYEGVFDFFEAVIRFYIIQPVYSTDLDIALSKEKLHAFIDRYNSRLHLFPSWSSCRFNFYPALYQV